MFDLSRKSSQRTGLKSMVAGGGTTAKDEALPEDTAMLRPDSHWTSCVPRPATSQAAFSTTGAGFDCAVTQ